MTIIFVLAAIAAIAIFSAWPAIGLYLTALCLPVIGVNLYFGSLIIPAADLIAVGTLIGWLINWLARSLFSDEKIKLRWPLFFPFGLFLILGLASSLFSDHTLNAVYYWLRWPFFLYFAYIFAPTNIIKNPRVLKTAVVMICLSALAVLASGYLSLIGQDWQDNFFRLKSWRLPLTNSYPFGENQNLVAEFLNIGAFLILVVKEFLKSDRARRLADVLFVASTLGIILTFSRAGWITLALQLGVYIWYAAKHKMIRRESIFLAAAIALIIAVPLAIKMVDLQKYNVSSTENRWLLTEIAMDAFKNRPIFGYGSGEFINLVDQNIYFRAKYGPAFDSHGVVQKIMAENGIFALLAWGFLLIYIIKIAFSAFQRYYPRIRWILPFGLSALGAIFFQFFNTSYYKGKAWLPVLLFLVAVRFIQQRYDKKNPDTAHTA